MRSFDARPALYFPRADAHTNRDPAGLLQRWLRGLVGIDPNDVDLNEHEIVSKIRVTDHDEVLWELRDRFDEILAEAYLNADQARALALQFGAAAVEAQDREPDR